MRSSATSAKSHRPRRDTRNVTSSRPGIAAREWGIGGLVNLVDGICKPRNPRGRDRRLDGDEEPQLLAACDAPEYFDYPVWSPDDSSIACTRVNRERERVSVALVDVATGSVRTIANDAWLFARNVYWSNGGRSLLVTGRLPEQSAYQIWSVPLAGEGIRPLTGTDSGLPRFAVAGHAETIVGVEFHTVPQVSDAPLVADMSSTILSRPMDVDRFGVIYAGAQKNIGAAGLAVLIVRKDLTGKARHVTPGVIDFKTMAESDSMWNTPPTYPWYIAALVFDWIKAEGGLEALGKRNRRKAEKLYAAIDRSDFYRNPVKPECR